MCLGRGTGLGDAEGELRLAELTHRRVCSCAGAGRCRWGCEACREQRGDSEHVRWPGRHCMRPPQPGTEGVCALQEHLTPTGHARPPPKTAFTRLRFRTHFCTRFSACRACSP